MKSQTTETNTATNNTMLNGMVQKSINRLLKNYERSGEGTDQPEW